MEILSIILISMFFSAFFSGMEIAFISSNKFRLELDRKQGKKHVNKIWMLIRKQEQYIATMLIGNNISLVIYGITMAKVLEPQIARFISNELLILLIQTIISTLIILVTAEFLPKTVFRINPNRALYFFLYPVLTFYYTFYFLAEGTIFLSRKIIKKVLKIEITGQEITFGKIDLNNLVEESQETINEDSTIDNSDLKFFQNALVFSETKIRTCVVPRTEIQALEKNSSIDELKQLIKETGFSKILIFDESIDNIIGYVQSNRLFSSPSSIEAITNKILIVPETMSAQKLLNQLMKHHQSIALVVDEFGGTSGIVTIEDLIEEIIGEIEDEHDVSDLVERKITEDEYEFSGRIEIDYLNDKYGLNLPDSTEYETLAGFIINKNERIPNLNEEFVIHNFQLTIIELDNPKIELVKLKVLED